MTGTRGGDRRRTISVFTWIGLTLAAAALWNSRLQGNTSGVASEPVALLLSAYAGFSSIFAWMLFSPGRRSTEDSPLLFIFGAVTLIAPGIIAFFLMPPGSPLRGWLTIGIFLMTVIAVLSPVPEQFFGVPRDRSSYIRPISDTLFSDVDCLDSDLHVSFEHLGGGSSASLSETVSASEWRREARDPWQDPFRGTGLEPTRVQRQRPSAAAFGERIPARPVPDDSDSETSRGESSARSAAPSDSVTPGTGNQRPRPVNPATAVRKQSTPPNPWITPALASAVPPVAPRNPTPHVASPVPSAVVTPPPPKIERVPPPPAFRADQPTFHAASVAAAAAAAAAASAKGVSGTSPTGIRPAVAFGFQAPSTQKVTASTPSVSRAATPPPQARTSQAVNPRTATAAPSSAIAAPIPAPILAPQTVSADAGSSLTRSVVDVQKRSIANEDFDAAFSSVSRDGKTMLQGEALGSDQQQPTSPRVPESRLTGDATKFERIQDEFGGEMIEGTIRVLFEPGQKRAHLHVPFSPPLPGIPEVEVEPVGDVDLRLKVAVRQSYGIRIEARRTEAADRLETEVGFAAVCSRPTRG
jgi:hypothetical protein